MENEDALFFAIVAVFLFALFGSANAINVSYGSCVSITDSNGSVENVCAPSLNNSTIQLTFPDFGIPEKLNYTCSSGELIRNAPPFYRNVTVYQNQTVYVDRNITIDRNITVYVNSTVEVVSNVSKIYDQKLDLTYDEEFLDFDSKLQIKAPPFPKINENKFLSGGEVAKYEAFNLAVACVNTTAFCEVTPPILTNNETYCNDKVSSAISNATNDALKLCPTPTSIPQTASNQANYDWVFYLAILAGLGYYYYTKKMADAKEPKVEEGLQ